MAQVETFTNFLKARSTGLKQKSSGWVEARRNTIGASEVAALTGHSPFETPKSLLLKKIQPTSMQSNVTCAWGTLLEPIARKYFEKKYSASVFGHSVSLNLAKDHPLYKKVACSPDGYFLNKDNSIVLLEFKCPFKRKIAMHRIPHHYTRQIQTGLAFSGQKVNKGLFVDAYFRMCTLKQLEPSFKHNEWLNGGNIYETKDTSVLAWGVCYLFSKQNLIPKQKEISDIADGHTSTFFKNIMTSIAEKSIWCSYGPVRMSFKKEYEDEEFLRRIRIENVFAWATKNPEIPKPVAVFTWKLLDITFFAWATKNPEIPKRLLYLLGNFST